MLDVWLRTEWLSCRKNSVLRCVERYSAAAASEYRRALRKVQEVEETMVQGEVEALNRRLSAANAEIRRYQTRLFAVSARWSRCGRRTRSWKHCAIRPGKTSCSPKSVPSPRCLISRVCR